MFLDRKTVGLVARVYFQKFKLVFGFVFLLDFCLQIFELVFGQNNFYVPDFFSVEKFSRLFMLINFHFLQIN